MTSTSADRIGTLATERGIKVAVAESLTSGLVAAAVGKGADAAEWFAGGIVAYQTEVKQRLLGVSGGTDPCSAECAAQLARGARELLDADIAVSTTGVGGPDPEDGHAPGTVFVGWSFGDRAGARRLAIEGGPEEVLERAVDEALRILVALAHGDEPVQPRGD
ncbi:CinA family protein [Microbacterium allomyrinae]|uniref:CinA family protein n=1 Tax=Microbacterium allomyrinae TaxID=2830666 RepID=UPI001E5B9CA1|nr:CinA family protein [Microbacterium allomyrinae]